MNETYGRTDSQKWITVQSPNLYLNAKLLAAAKVEREIMAGIISSELAKMPFLYAIYTQRQLAGGGVSEAPSRKAALSFYPSRSGDLVYQLKPYFIDQASAEGTTHGSPWNYDTHVPMLWFGADIASGIYQTQVDIADIVPTLCTILQIPMPVWTQGQVLEEILPGR